MYITTLRQAQNINQDRLAEAMGIARRTYLAWESGETKDIKTPLLIRALRFLGGSFNHLALLDGASEDAARTLAEDWLMRRSGAQQQHSDQPPGEVRRVIEIGIEEPERLDQIIDRLRSDARADPLILDLVLAYLDGRRSNRAG